MYHLENYGPIDKCLASTKLLNNLNLASTYVQALQTWNTEHLTLYKLYRR